MESLYKLNAIDVIQKLKSGAVSIHDTLDCLQDRIEQVDPAINSLPTLCFDRARQHADKLQQLPVKERGPLCGLPVTIKDLMPVEGVRTTFGSRVFDQYIPKNSDRLVRLIESKGGIVYAKSNTPEFGAGGMTFNDVFGITHSPYHTAFSSGGSSGGAAASLASGCAWLSHGSDMAGSLRTPASFCGATSLRPSPGRIKFDSDYTPYDILSAEGPMARTVHDLAIFADVMFNHDNQYFYAASDKPLMPSKIAVSHDLGITRVSNEINDKFQAFIEMLSAKTPGVKDSCPDLSGVDDCFDALRAHSYAIGLEGVLNEHPDVLKPEVIWNIESGLSLNSDQLRHAVRTQGQIINRAAQFMQDVDLLICPATSVTGVDAQLRYPDSDKGVPVPEYYRWLAIAYAITVTALPVLTLPVAITSSGLPFAVQLIGKPGGELQLFQYARKIEILSGWTGTPVDPYTPG